MKGPMPTPALPRPIARERFFSKYMATVTVAGTKQNPLPVPEIKDDGGIFRHENGIHYEILTSQGKKNELLLWLFLLTIYYIKSIQAFDVLQYTHSVISFHLYILNNDT